VSNEHELLPSGLVLSQLQRCVRAAEHHGALFCAIMAA